MSPPKTAKPTNEGKKATRKKRIGYDGYADGPWKIIMRLGIVLLVAIMAGGVYLAFRYKKSAKDSTSLLQESEAAQKAGDREESLRLANQAVRSAETPEKRVAALLKAADLTLPTVDAETTKPPDMEVLNQLRDSMKLRHEAWRQAPTDVTNGMVLLEYQRAVSKYSTPSRASWNEVKRFADSLLTQNGPGQWKAAAIYAEAQLAGWAATADIPVRAVDFEQLVSRVDLATIPEAEWFGRIAISMLQLRAGSESENKTIQDATRDLIKRWSERPATDIDTQYWQARLQAASADAANQQSKIEAVRELQAQILSKGSVETNLQFATDLASSNRNIVKADSVRLVDEGVTEAITFLEAALNKHPDSIDLKLLRGNYLADSGKWPAAVTLFAEVSATPMPQPSPEAFKRYRQQSQAYYGEAEARLSSLTKESANEDRQAIELLIDKLRNHPSLEPRILLLEARLRARDGQLLEAAARAKAVSEMISGPEAHLTLGLILLRAGESGAAAEALMKAVPMAARLGAADRLDLTLAISRFLLRTKRLEPAAKMLENARTQLPNHAELAELALTVQAAQLASMRAKGDPATDLLAAALEEEIDKIDAKNESKDRIRATYLVATGNPQRARNLLTTLPLSSPNLAAWRQHLNAFPESVSVFASWASRRTTNVADGPARRLLLERLSNNPADVESIRRLHRAASTPLSNQHLTCAKAHMLASDVSKARKSFAAARKAGLPEIQTTRFSVLLARAANDQEELAELAAEEALNETRQAWRQALVRMLEQNWPEADALLEQVTTAWPFFSEAWHDRAAIRFQLGDLKLAEQYCRQALVVRPDRRNSLALYAQIRLQMGNPDESIGSLVELFRLSPSPEQLEQILIQLEQSKGSRAAEIARTRLAREMPENYRNRQGLAGLFVRNNNTAQAKKVLDDLISEQPLLTTAVSSRAIIDFLAGDRIAAKARIEARIKHGDMTAGDWLEVAAFYQRVEGGTSVENAFLSASRCEDAADHAVNDRWADFLYQSGQHQRAAALYGRLWNEKPITFRGARLAECLLELKLPDQAERIMAIIATHEPKPNLQIAYARLASLKQHYQEADEGFSLAIEQSPKDPRLRTFRGTHRLAGENPTTGIEDLQEAIRMAPNYLRPRAELWYFLLSRQRLDEAKEPLEMDENNPLKNHPAIQLMNGILELRKGNYSAATDALFEQAVRGVGGNLSMEMLQRALEAGCRFESAIKLINRLAQTRPKNPALLHNRAWNRAFLALDLEKAVQDAQAAREIAKQGDKGLLAATHGYVLARTGKSQESWQVLEPLANATDPADPIVRLYRYEALRNHPQYKNLAAAELAALAKSPEPSAPAFGYYIALADLSWRIDKPEAKALLPALQSAALNCRTTTESDVITASILAGLGRVQYLGGSDAVVALSNLRQSAQLSNGPAPHLFRAVILKSRGDNAGAQKARAKAVSLLTSEHPRYLHERLLGKK